MQCRNAIFFDLVNATLQSFTKQCTIFIPFCGTPLPCPSPLPFIVPLTFISPRCDLMLLNVHQHENVNALGIFTTKLNYWAI